jgi:hypothetical protein
MFTFKVTNVQNVHHQHQCVIDFDVQQIGRCYVLLLMEEWHMQFQFHASCLAVYVVLRCEQHSSEHPTGKCLLVLGRVILVDTAHSLFSNST